MRAKAAGRDLWVLAMVVLALLCPRLLGAEPKPLIGVELRIEARNIRRNLHKHIDDIEKDLSRLVTDLSTKSQGFLTWRPLVEVPDPSQLSAVLHVSLVQEAGGTIMLRFSGDTGAAGSRFNCSEGALGPVTFGEMTDLDRQLFTSLGSQPTGDAEALKERIRNQLALTDFRVALGKVFASQIPICHSAEPRQQGLVAIGITQSDLEVDENSKMKLFLCSRIPEDLGAPRGGSLELDAAIQTGIYPKGERGNWIQGHVSSCTFGYLVKDPCMTKIRLMFQKQIDRSLDVLMIDFRRRYSGTQGNQVASPRKDWKP